MNNVSNCAASVFSSNDIPGIAIGVSGELFCSIHEKYDLFTRNGSREAFLDAIAFGEEETAELATFVGPDLAEECQGQYVLFYIE